MDKQKELNIKKISVGKYGHFDIEVPFLRLGNGNPKLTMLTGMHGDEYSGLLILRKLLNEVELLQGTLQVIFSANPLARAQKRRETEADLLDLNRVFPGKENGSITERIAHKIVSVVGDSDLVIDLHTMKSRVSPTVIQISCKGGVDEKCADYIKAFNNEKVWLIETTNEVRYAQTMCSFLSRQLVPNFGIETNNVDKISENDVGKIIDGLKSVMAKLGMIEYDIKNCEPKFFRREKIYGHYSGIFIPLKEPDSEIAEGELVGYIMDVHDMQLKEVVSQKNGFISDIHARHFVNEGDHIYSLGIKIGGQK